MPERGGTCAVNLVASPLLKVQARQVFKVGGSRAGLKAFPPTDSLQNNSSLLQRNSSVTASEFRQLQTLCVPELFCIRRQSAANRGRARQTAALGGSYRVQIRRNSTWSVRN